MHVGVRVHLRDVERLDDLDDVTAPEPVEPGDLVASANDVLVVEAVLATPPGWRCVPVLAHRIEIFAGDGQYAEPS